MEDQASLVELAECGCRWQGDGKASALEETQWVFEERRRVCWSGEDVDVRGFAPDVCA